MQTALANPLNDATGVSEALGRLGFAVSTLSNASKQAMEQGLPGIQRDGFECGYRHGLLCGARNRG